MFEQLLRYFKNITIQVLMSLCCRKFKYRMNDGLNLYNNQFAETLSDIKKQQSQILELMLKNEISFSFKC